MVPSSSQSYSYICKMFSLYIYILYICRLFQVQQFTHHNTAREILPVLNCEILPVLNCKILPVLNCEILPVLNCEILPMLNCEITPVLNCRACAHKMLEPCSRFVRSVCYSLSLLIQSCPFYYCLELLELLAIC